MSTRIHLLAGLLLAAAALDAAESLQWESEPGAGELSWSAYYEGEELPGRFERFDVAMETDPSGAPSSLTVDVETGSADMRDREINAEIGEPEWFDVSAFPTARYESQDIRPVGDGFRAYGRLRLKGVEQALEIPLDWQRDGDAGELSGSIRLSRQDWNIGTGEWSSDASLSDRVDLRWRVRLVPER